MSTATRYQIQDRAVSYRPIPTIIYTARPHSVLLHLHGPIPVPHAPGERCVTGAGLILVLTYDPDGAGGVRAGHLIPRGHIPSFLKSLQKSHAPGAFLWLQNLLPIHDSFKGDWFSHSTSGVTTVCPSLSNSYFTFCIIFQSSD